MRDELLALLGVVAASGCSYDWSVRSSPQDAGGDVASRPDAAADADVPPEGSTDGPVDVSVADSPPDASEAAPPPNCTALEAQVQQTRAAALGCDGTTSACQTVVDDECGCMVVVGGDDTATATENYLAAIAQLKNSSCTLACSGCGTAPMKGLCVLNEAGSSALACNQL